MKERFFSHGGGGRGMLVVHPFHSEPIRANPALFLSVGRTPGEGRRTCRCAAGYLVCRIGGQSNKDNR